MGQFIPLISGLLGAIVGGFMTVFGSMKVLSTSMANLERAEIRRLKVECLSNLVGLSKPAIIKPRFWASLNQLAVRLPY